MSRFVDQVLPGDVAKLKQFTLKPGIESGSNIDLVPPPYFTPMNLPFGYNYAQNPYTKEVKPGSTVEPGMESDDQEFDRVVNVTSRVSGAGYFIAHDEYPVPSAPRRQPNMSDPQVAVIMTEMYAAMEERPIWTRRSMWNRLGSKFAELPKSGSLVRAHLQYAGYQFKGGPWRDSLVKYGVDPRSDPKYRIYQTLIFKLHKTRIGTVGRSWQSVRRTEVGVTNFGKYWQELGDKDGPRETHIFNGEAFSTDGKVWQVCDITDPLLSQLFASAEVRTSCDTEVSGFYYRVLWSAAKAIMKCKMLAIRFGRTLTDEDFRVTLDAAKGPNDGGDGSGTSIGLTLPDLQLTSAECEQLRGKKMKPGLKAGRDRWEERKKKTHYRIRIPYKQAEEREAEKMLQLLLQGKNAAAGTAAAEGVEGPEEGEENVSEEMEEQPIPAARVTIEEGRRSPLEEALDENGREDQYANVEEELEEDRDQDPFQELLNELDEEGEGSSEEDDEEEDDEDEGEEENEIDISGSEVESEAERGSRKRPLEYGAEEGEEDEEDEDYDEEQYDDEEADLEGQEYSGEEGVEEAYEEDDADGAFDEGRWRSDYEEAYDDEDQAQEGHATME